MSTTTPKKSRRCIGELRDRHGRPVDRCSRRTSAEDGYCDNCRRRARQRDKEAKKRWHEEQERRKYNEINGILAARLRQHSPELYNTWVAEATAEVNAHLEGARDAVRP